MGTFAALLAFYVWNSPLTGGFPSQKPVTRNFNISFDLRLNKQLGKQSRRRWFETPSRSFWRQCNETTSPHIKSIGPTSDRLDRRHTEIFWSSILLEDASRNNWPSQFSFGTIYWYPAFLLNSLTQMNIMSQVINSIVPFVKEVTINWVKHERIKVYDIPNTATVGEHRRWTGSIQYMIFIQIIHIMIFILWWFI